MSNRHRWSLLRRRSLILRIVSVLGVIAVVFAISFAHRNRPQPVRALQVPTDVDLEVPVENPGYLGMGSCRECHAERAAEFQETRHFLACTVPQIGQMPEGFDPPRNRLQSRVPNVHFEMGHYGSEFSMTAAQASVSGNRRGAAPIQFVYGAGAGTDEVYFTIRDGRYFEMPLAWLHPLDCWGASPFDPDSFETLYARPWTLRCVECHNTWFAHTPGTLNEYQPDSFLAGVTCEVCHGPGQGHVEHHRAHREDKQAFDIIHPGHLDRERKLDLCAYCHSNSVQHLGRALAYRPGEPLSDHYRTIKNKYPEDDRVANQMEYFRQSRCFQQDQAMTCVTCHNPHRPGPVGRAGGCLQCHQQVDCGEQERLPVAVRDNCAGCHMPARSKVQVNFTTESDSYIAPVNRWEHRIAVYPDARDKVLLEWLQSQTDESSRDEVGRLKSALADFWISTGDSRRAEYRFLAAIDAYRLGLKYVDTPETRQKLQQAIQTRTQLDDDWNLATRQFREQQTARAVATLERMLSVKPDMALAHGKLGTIYAIMGRMDLARQHLEAVAECDPNDPYGAAMLGWLAYLGKRYDEAIAAYAQAEAIEPRDAGLTYRIGLAHLAMNQLQEAADRFERVLEIDPNHVDACLGLAESLRRQGRAVEAIPFAVRAAKLSGFQNAEQLAVLAELCFEAGAVHEGRQFSRRAQEVATKTQSSAVARIVERMKAAERKGQLRPQTPAASGDASKPR